MSTQRSATTPSERFHAAAALHRQGLLAEAATAYGELLRQHPAHADALHMLGLVLLQQGQHDAGIRRIGESLRVNPRQPMAHANLARAHANSGQPERAVATISEALRLDAGFTDGWFFRAELLASLGRREEALRDYTRVLSLQPAHVAALNNRGNLQLQGGNALAAQRDYEAALRLEPGFAEAHNNLCTAMLELGEPESALECADRAIALRATFAEAHNNRGNALRAMRRLDEARESFERALALDAQFPEALGNLCGTLIALRRHTETLPLYERLLSLAPEYPFAVDASLQVRRDQCDWTDHEDRAMAVRAAVAGGGLADYPWYFLSVSADPEEQLRCARGYAQHCCPRPFAPTHGMRRPSARIRLACVSSDFGDHPVSHLTAGMFGAHDRARFEVFAVSLSRVDANLPDAARLWAAFDQVLDVSSLNDEAAARRVAEAGIDILVDLNGHTHGARPGLLARRPAPLQVSFLGYAGTTGAPWIDYLVGDDVVLPRGEAGYSERLVRLAGCCLPRDDSERVPSPGTRAAEGLPDSGFVFCAFANSYKLAPGVFDAWMRLLREVPSSVLWLRRPGTVAVENLRREARARGVEPERLVFAARVASRQDHLSRLRLADLFLDTHPYGAHSTASDALYAGLPVLTCRGTAFAGRVAASLLLASGLPELVAADSRDCERIALALASDREALGALRNRVALLHEPGGPFDTRAFTGRLEQAFERMWSLASSGAPPADIEVT